MVDVWWVVYGVDMLLGTCGLLVMLLGACGLVDMLLGACGMVDMLLGDLWPSRVWQKVNGQELNGTSEEALCS